MINILKTIVNYVKPYKSNQIENEFTELNYQYWKKKTLLLPKIVIA